MTRSVGMRLKDIMDEILWIESMIEGRTYFAFEEDRAFRYAIERSILIISEASRYVPETMRLRRPEIPWRQVADIGNVVRHEYQHIASNLIWEVATLHLSPLKVAIAELQTLDLP